MDKQYETYKKNKTELLAKLQELGRINERIKIFEQASALLAERENLPVMGNPSTKARV